MGHSVPHVFPITAPTMQIFSFWDSLKKPHRVLGLLDIYVHVIIIIIILIRKLTPKHCSVL